MAWFDQQAYENKSDEWATPQSFIRPLKEAVNGFDLDPAAGAEAEPIAEERYTEEDDGLSHKWFGTVWLNPPFSNKVDWLKKAVKEVNVGRVDTVVCLLPVDTSTRWFHDWFSKNAALICFIGPGRMDFDRRGEPGDNGSPNFAVMTVVIGEIPNEDTVEFLQSRGVVYQGGKLRQKDKQMMLKMREFGQNAGDVGKKSRGDD